MPELPLLCPRHGPVTGGECERCRTYHDARERGKRAAQQAATIAGAALVGLTIVDKLASWSWDARHWTLAIGLGIAMAAMPVASFIDRFLRPPRSDK